MPSSEHEARLGQLQVVLLPQGLTRCSGSRRTSSGREDTDDRDPCEVYFYDYKDVDGRKLPHRIEVRYGDKRYAVLTVDKYTLAKTNLGLEQTPRTRAGGRDHPTPAPHTSCSRDTRTWLCRGRSSRGADAGARLRRRPVRRCREKANKKLVKVFGAGGFSRLNNFGTGIIISKDGYILTVASQLLDTSDLVVHLYDGQRLKAQVDRDRAGTRRRDRQDPVGEEARRAARLDLDYFDFAEAAKRPPAEPGDWVIALSNTFEIALRDEPLSVQRGVMSAYTKLAGRRGVFEFPYTGDVYVVDAITNNPGAAGGALSTRKGELLGIIGREIKNTLSETWMNYAIPVNAKAEVRLRETVKDKDGKEVEQEKIEVVSMPKFVELGMKGKYKPDQQTEGDRRRGRLPRHHLRAEHAGADAGLHRGRGSRFAGREGRIAAGRPRQLRGRRADRQHQGVPRVHEDAHPAGDQRFGSRCAAARRSQTRRVDSRYARRRSPADRTVHTHSAIRQTADNHPNGMTPTEPGFRTDESTSRGFAVVRGAWLVTAMPARRSRKQT